MTHETSSRSGLYIVLAVLVGTALGYGVKTFMLSVSGADISFKQCTVKTTMRHLWSDHVIWTRNYIISALANLDDLKNVTERLLRNQADIGAAVSAYYGPDAGIKLTDLLKEHILIAAKVVDAAKTNNKATLAQENEAWHKNAQDISKFLSSANPQWAYDDLIKMMNMHLQLTTDEVVARLQKNWTNDIAAFDKVYNEILEMADYLTNGIAKQFPEKF